jgi:hypothetical protein
MAGRARTKATTGAVDTANVIETRDLHDGAATIGIDTLSAAIVEYECD